MTQQARRKHEVRARMAQTGEKYTEALRAVADDGPFETQVSTLIARGYPQLAGMDEAAFTALLEPLRAAARGHGDRRVIVIDRALVAPGDQVARLAMGTKQGFTDMDPKELTRFVPIDGLAPPGPAYLLDGADTGGDTLNVTPDDAAVTIAGRGRTPLTIEEGIALVTHHPTILRRLNCFSLLGSRCGDRRVPALWVSKGRPRLGWCWAGNPHTWLGTASCDARIGSPLPPG